MKYILTIMLFLFSVIVNAQFYRLSISPYYSEATGSTLISSDDY